MTYEATKSTHRVEVVPLVLEKHPNADRLSVVRIFGFTCVTGTDQWAGHDRAAYIPPDSLVDIRREEFSFLAEQAKENGKARIKAKKLRGVLSFGLLVPAPAGAEIGDDVTEKLGVEHYEPAPAGSQNRGGLMMGGEVASPPPIHTVKYDLEAGRRYAQKLFVPGEPVVVTEKIHGCASRYVFVDGQMYCGSRNEWKKEYPSYDHVTVDSLLATGKVDEERANEIVSNLKSKKAEKNLWWKALDDTPALRKFCEDNPGTVVYGEVYGGSVQDLPYGHKKGEVSFAAYDVMKDGRWLDAQESRQMLQRAGVPVVPILAGESPLDKFPPDLIGIPFDFDQVCEMAEGKSIVPGANNVREGVVVKTIKERYDDRLGRACLKWVGATYLERSK